MPRMFEQRVRDYGPKVLLRVLRGKESDEITWQDVNSKATLFKKALAETLEEYEISCIH